MIGAKQKIAGSDSPLVALILETPEEIEQIGALISRKVIVEALDLRKHVRCKGDNGKYLPYLLLEPFLPKADLFNKVQNRLEPLFQ